MVHSHCTGGNSPAICMQGLNPVTTQICHKGYPDRFQQEMLITEDGYPLYHRSDFGVSFPVPVKTSEGTVTAGIDNRRVVPYNPYLSLYYKAHINVMVGGSFKAVKYIHKYTHKSGDRATAILESEHDEINGHLHGRYIGPTEAVWQLVQFSTHEPEVLPPVTTLVLHHPGQQAIYFPEQDDPGALQERLNRSMTTLIVFFKFNSENVDGRQYLYQEFPEHYVYRPKVGWKCRKQRYSIGRMSSASPFMGECDYLRLLLTVVCGARSFEDLRTVDRIQFDTFKGACIALRLLEEDGEWIAIFRDAQEFMTGRAFRHLFALALQHTTMSNPLPNWEKFRDDFCDDMVDLLVTGRIMISVGGEAMGAGLASDYALYQFKSSLMNIVCS